MNTLSWPPRGAEKHSASKHPFETLWNLGVTILNEGMIRNGGNTDVDGVKTTHNCREGFSYYLSCLDQMNASAM